MIPDFGPLTIKLVICFLHLFFPPLARCWSEAFILLCEDRPYVGLVRRLILEGRGGTFVWPPSRNAQNGAIRRRLELFGTGCAEGCLGTNPSLARGSAPCADLAGHGVVSIVTWPGPRICLMNIYGRLGYSEDLDFG